MKGQMFLAASLLILVFLALLASQAPRETRKPLLLSNIFAEYEKAAHASFAYPASDAASRLASFSSMVRERSEGGFTAVYSLSKHEGGQLEVTLSNFLGVPITGIRIKNNITSQEPSYSSLNDDSSLFIAFPGVSGDYKVSISYDTPSGKGTLEYSGKALQGRFSSHFQLTLKSGAHEVSRALRTSNYDL